MIGNHRLQDFWTPLECLSHINIRDMWGISHSINFFLTLLSDRTIRIHTDSMVVLFCLQRMGSLHSPPLNQATQDLISLCHQIKISFEHVHISGKLNDHADQGSRQEPLSTEWMLDPELFAAICRRIFRYNSSGPLCHRGYCQDSLLHFPLLGSTGFPRGFLGSFFGLE